MPPPTKSSRFSFELWEPWCKNEAPAFRRSAVTRQKTAASSFFFSCFMWASVVSGSPFTCTKNATLFHFLQRAESKRREIMWLLKKKNPQSKVVFFFLFFLIQTNSLVLQRVNNTVTERESLFLVFHSTDLRFRWSHSQLWVRLKGHGDNPGSTFPT